MKIVSIASARPNFVKLAAVHHAMTALRPDWTHVIVHTGQHYDPLFSDVFFEQLSIPLPVQNLGIAGGTREEVIDRTMASLTAALPALSPDIILVYGDVNGAVGAAKAAKAAGIRLAHVEAGLRSFDPSMPEELNRIAIDALADILLCSEQSGVDHLQKENVAGTVHLVGNTMIDTLIRMLPHIEQAHVPEKPSAAYAVTTLHRPSNVDTREALERNIAFLTDLCTHIPLVLPLHHRTKAALEKFGLMAVLPRNLHIVAPMGYVSFLALVKDAAFILTDSGGIQEEATFLQKKCFTLRKNTERPSTIMSGSNTLIDLDIPADRDAVLTYAAHPMEPTVTVPVLWDGKAGARIVEALS